MSNNTGIECTVCYPWFFWNKPEPKQEETNSEDYTIQEEETNPEDYTKQEETEESLKRNPFCLDPEYFKKFDWLKDESEEGEDYGSNLITRDEFLKNMFLGPFHKKPQSTSQQNLYFIGLDNDKMFLYLSDELDHSIIMNECKTNFEYAQINEPQKVVFQLNDVNPLEVDQNVKLFMKHFGIENTRGGSYTDVILQDPFAIDLSEMSNGL